MSLASQVLTGLVALLHVYFLVLEMFLWTTPLGQKTFKRTAEEQESTRVLAANQGLYNGFLAAGLVWSLVASEPIAMPVRVFFLACVVVAGIYGAATAARQILFAQAIPAAAALGVTLAVRGGW
jgi:putative membrane protein